MKYGQIVLKRSGMGTTFRWRSCLFCSRSIHHLFPNAIHSNKICISAFDKPKKGRVELHFINRGIYTSSGWDYTLMKRIKERMIWYSSRISIFRAMGVEPQKDTYIWMEGTPCE